MYSEFIYAYYFIYFIACAVMPVHIYIAFSCVLHRLTIVRCFHSGHY